MTHPTLPASSSLPRLQGRRVLITGAASGIGWACAEAALQAGARVALLDRHRPDLSRLPAPWQGQALALRDGCISETAILPACRFKRGWAMLPGRST